MQHPPLPWDPAFDAIVRRVYRETVLGSAKSPELPSAPQGPGKARYYSGLLLLLPIVTAPIGLGLLLSYALAKRRAEKLKSQLNALARGRVRRLHPIMINSAYTGGKIDRAPGMYIGCADGKPDLSFEEIGGIALAVMGAADPPTPYDDELQRIAEDIRFVHDRRRKLPEGVCPGREVYLFDVFLLRSEAGPDTFPSVAALVEPGPQGSMVVVPVPVVERALGEWSRR